MARPEELSGQIWPIHLKPFDDELLSCWMVRLPHAYGVKPVWFWNRVWKRDAVAYRFVDRSAPVELLRLLSAGTGTRYERVVQTTLHPLAEVRSIPAAVSSLRYCPECLAADPVPYFRREWQMGFLLVCPLHGVRLRAACHRCREPLTPELLGLRCAVGRVLLALPGRPAGTFYRGRTTSPWPGSRLGTTVMESGVERLRDFKGLCRQPRFPERDSHRGCNGAAWRRCDARFGS